MELLLNLAWMLLAALMISVWLRSAPSEGESRKTQFVALTLLILILFPVISVTDDLMAAQNPAEADCCLRKDHVVASSHSMIPMAAALPLPTFAEMTLGIPHFAAPSNFTLPRVACPALASIQNRPPPTV
jgi:hypothetical protein